jgi:hypothetical protein
MKFITATVWQFCTNLEKVTIRGILSDKFFSMVGAELIFGAL